MSKKRRRDNAEGTEEKNLPATQQGDSNISNPEKEDQKMDSKTRRNLLQFIGDGAKAAGDKLATFNEEHKVIATAGKVGVGLLALGGIAVGVYKAVTGKDEDEAVCETNAEEVEDDYYDDFVEDLDEEELEDDEEETSDSEPEAEAETSDEA